MYSDGISSLRRINAPIFDSPKFSNAFQRIVWKSRRPPIPFFMFGS